MGGCKACKEEITFLHPEDPLLHHPAQIGVKDIGLCFFHIGNMHFRRLHPVAVREFGMKPLEISAQILSKQKLTVLMPVIGILPQREGKHDAFLHQRIQVGHQFLPGM